MIPVKPMRRLPKNGLYFVLPETRGSRSNGSSGPKPHHARQPAKKGVAFVQAEQFIDDPPIQRRKSPVLRGMGTVGMWLIAL